MTPLLVTLLCAAPPAERLFTELDVALPGRPASAVAISPTDDKIVLAAVEGLLFRSNNGGATWDLVLRTSAALGWLAGVNETPSKRVRPLGEPSHKKPSGVCAMATTCACGSPSATVKTRRL